MKLRHDIGHPPPAWWQEESESRWPFKRLKYLVRLNPTKREVRGRADDTEVSFLPMEAVGEYGGLDLTVSRPLADVLDGYTYFRDGDVLVAKITPCFENGKAAVATGLINGIGFGTTELHVLRPGEELDTKYLFYLTISDHFRRLGTSTMYGAGGQKRVPEDYVENLVHPLPELRSQQAIADFLDHETAKIDVLIDQKQRLIELLQEKRAALINGAITKGLDSNVEMKNSGVEGLGQVPCHWRTIQLRWLLKDGPKNGLSPPIGERGDIPTFSLSAVRSGKIDIEGNLKYADTTHAEASRFEVRRGDVLVLRGNGNLHYVGLAGIVDEKPPAGCIYPDLLIRLRPKRVLEPWFLVKALNSRAIRPQVEKASFTSAGIWKISGSRLGSLRLPIPPRSEQEEIKEFLSPMLETLGQLTGEISKQCDLLREYRTALISAAVTGTIDIREAAA